MHGDQSLWVYFSDAGMVVKFVMLLLIAASIASWTFIFQRAAFFKKNRRAAKLFEGRFWSGIELNQLFQQLDKTPEQQGGMATIFQAGYKEFLNVKASGYDNTLGLMDNVQRAMRGAYTREMEKLESQLPFLASVGSISPYVGLFGTVWGIMTAFHALGNVQQATIAMVAPGISEALIATAMGLFAAIPAVLAYNRYAAQAERLLGQYETFQEEFLNVLQRQ